MTATSTMSRLESLILSCSPGGPRFADEPQAVIQLLKTSADVTMRSLLAIPFLIFPSIIISGCSLTSAQNPDSSEVRFEVEKTTFHKAETVEARFVNSSAETIYIVSFGSCASILQKMDETGWSSLYFPDLSCPTVISYWPFEAGEVEHFSFTPEHIRTLVAEPEGTYRLMWQVAPSENSAEAEAVVSPVFQIVE
ncbi:hypothetical protein [Rhodocaloribacter sp.]